MTKALGAKIPHSVLEILRDFDENYVLAAARNYLDDEIILQITDVVTPEITMSMDHRCLRYNFFVFESNTLTVGYIKDDFNPYDLTEDLRFHGSLEGKFNSASVNLPTGVKFKVVFRGIFQKSTYGFLLIDNVTITDGECEKCGTSEFKCSDVSDECIPLNKVCDLEPDCIGGEDEKSCNFLRCWVANYSFCNLKEQKFSDSISNIYLINHMYNVITIDLSYNFLITWKLVSYTKKLYLHHNSITSLNHTLYDRQSEARLQYLDLSYNKIISINNEDLEDLPNLLYLIFHENRLTHIQEKAFDKLTKLIHLDLSNNNLRNLNRFHFMYLSRLQYLNLQNNDVKVVEGMFDSLMNILYLQVDSYTLCCAQPKAVGKIQCVAPLNEISSCHNLIHLHILRIIIWYIALLALFGNMSAIFYRLYCVKKKPVTTFDIYSLNLGLADFFMGVYLYIIAGANIAFSGRYGFEDFSWRHSPYCIFAGVLATLSSEASALFVLLITIDRILVVRYPFSTLKKRIRVSKLNSSLVWTIALFLSVIPLTGSEYFDDYYSSSGVCIYLPLSVLRKAGWEYSMIIFVGANFLIFIATLIGQIVIFMDVVRMGKKTALHSVNRQRKREVGIAKTLITVAVTDMFCWIPIGAIGLLTFMGIDVTVQVYAWIIVAVLPINSALNPLIYTFSAIMRHGSHKNRNQKTGCTKETGYNKPNERNL
ncbi:G-protein coupled receptor GRL101-like, partial [Saccostrea cucullata]|uniref:G-protein coupled receptor GRL101-like n=1 Tax=Saccostrea cuccullata TaxID=36930 RepID=UPI002ED11202